MELDENARTAARELGDAINIAIESSDDVNTAIEELRALGYEPLVTMRLEIALTKGGEKESASFELDFTDDDLKTLERMRIKVN